MTHLTRDSSPAKSLGTRLSYKFNPNRPALCFFKQSVYYAKRICSIMCLSLLIVSGQYIAHSQALYGHVTQWVWSRGSVGVVIMCVSLFPTKSILSSFCVVTRSICLIMAHRLCEVM